MRHLSVIQLLLFDARIDFFYNMLSFATVSTLRLWAETAMPTISSTLISSSLEVDVDVCFIITISHVGVSNLYRFNIICGR